MASPDTPELLEELGHLSEESWGSSVGRAGPGAWVAAGRARWGGPPAGLGQTGVPQGPRPAPAAPGLPPPPAPGSPSQSLLCLGPGPGAGALPWAWPAAPARRAACSPGVWQSRRAECCPGGREREAAERARRRRRRLRRRLPRRWRPGREAGDPGFPGGPAGADARAWGSAGFGPPGARMVRSGTALPISRAEGASLTGVPACGKGRRTGRRSPGGVAPLRPGEAGVDLGHPGRAGARKVWGTWGRMQVEAAACDRQGF